MNPHSITARVYFEDTDAGGVVYHTTYLRYMERGRTEWLRAQGWTLAQVHELGVVLVVTKIEVDFLSAAILEDKLDIVTECTHHTRARVFFTQSIRLCADSAQPGQSADVRSGQRATEICSARVCCACKLLSSPRASAIPASLVRAFERCQRR